MVLKQSNWVRRHKNALYGVVKYLYTEHVNTKINISVTVTPVVDYRGRREN
jgi:hypothetical protein